MGVPTFGRGVVLITAFVVGGLTSSFSVARAHPTTQGPSAVPLETRVKAYWERRLAKDMSGMYEFYSTEYRSKVSRDEFLKQIRLVRFELSDVAVAKADVQGDRAMVTVTFRMQLPTVSPDKLASQSDETWVKEADGVWRKLDEPLVVPFPPPGPRASSGAGSIGKGE